MLLSTGQRAQPWHPATAGYLHSKTALGIDRVIKIVRLPVTRYIRQ